MALFTTGFGISNISGSVGGASFSKCLSGNIIMQKPSQVNKRSIKQNNHRAIFYRISNYWRSSLSVNDKILWNTFASTMLFKNRVGVDVHLSGFQIFCKAQYYHILVGHSFPQPCPSNTGFADNFTIDGDNILLDVAQQELSWTTASFVGVDTTDYDNHLIISISRHYAYSSTLKPKKCRFITTTSPGLGGYYPAKFDLVGYYPIDKYITVKVILLSSDGRFTNPVYQYTKGI